jgi:hypothetical protein
VPYALRELRPEIKQVKVGVRRQISAGISEAKRFYEVQLELEDPGSLGHNQIEVVTAGSNFTRRVQVFGDKTDKFEDPRTLADAYLVHYEFEGKVVDIRRLHYSPHHFRSLQVRVYPDASTKEKIPRIDGITVRHSTIIKGSYLSRPANLQVREAVRADGGPGSAWYIDFGGEPQPCDRLTFQIQGEAIERPFRLQKADPKEPRQDIPGADWRWRAEGGRQELELVFPEVFARRLRLVVTDFANEPLSLQSVQYAAPIRQVVFPLAKEKKYALPFRVYYGNSQAGPARYDFERKFREETNPTLDELTLGERTANPSYRPPEPTLSERMPLLIYAVLATACLILLAILGLLARRVLQDQKMLHGNKINAGAFALPK